MTAKKKKATFEEGMEALEQLIGQLGESGRSLDESMKTYEAGMQLVRELEKTLEGHRRRVEQIDLETAEIEAFEEKENGL